MPQFRDYFLDQTNENARLFRQHEQLKTLIGGLVPAEIDPTAVHMALDLACGPGAWALDFARTYPSAEVIGIDISEIPLGEAWRRAVQEHLANVRFREADLTSAAGLPLPDNQFDLVWARAVFLHLRTDSWEPLLREVYRVLRPDGAFVVVDTDAMAGSTSNEPYRQLEQLLTTLLIKGGRMPRFGPLGPGLMRRVGFERLYVRPYLLTWSYQQGDQPIPEEVRRGQANVLSALYNARPALISAGLITREEFDQLYEDACQRMEHDPDQVTIELLFSISGRKPA